LRVTPYSTFSTPSMMPSSGMLVTPTRMNPACWSAAKKGAVRSGTLPRNARDPRVAGIPAMVALSFTSNGTPANGASITPCAARDLAA
jgi:hypothetical protein